MSAIANRYKRGDLLGVGFECDFGGVRVHSIAWANADVERLRDDPVFTEGLVIDQCNVDLGCGGPLVINVPAFHSKEAHEEAIAAVKKMNREVVLVPCRDDFEENVALKARVLELESQLAAINTVQSDEVVITTPVFLPNDIVTGFPESVPSSDNGGFVLPEFTESPIIIEQSEPFPLVEMSEVISTHETIEPAVTETPVEPIQEPVVEVSELTASPPSQAVDTPIQEPVANAIASGDHTETVATIAAPDIPPAVVEEEDSEAWKPNPGDSEAATIRSYLKQFGVATSNNQVITALAEFGIEVTSSQVFMAKKAMKQ